MEPKINPSGRVVKPTPSKTKLAPQPQKSRRRLPKTTQKLLPPSKTPQSAQKPKSAASIPWLKWLAQWTALGILFGGTSLVALGTWLSVQLILDPDLGLSINQKLPKWTQIPIPVKGSAQTLGQIKSSLEKAGFVAGKPIALPKSEEKRAFFAGLPSDLLLPVLVNKNDASRLICAKSCPQIIELRVYESVPNPQQDPNGAQYYRLVNQYPVEGVAASFVVASTPIFSGIQGSNKSVPLTNANLIEGKGPGVGAWLTISGEKTENNSKITYGQLLHYNPKYYHIIVLTDWVSSGERLPSWQQMSREGEPELVIDRTEGLDPLFSVYQVQPRPFTPNPVQLTSLSLDEPALSDEGYKHALWLARNGLWSIALDKLTTFRAKYQGKWTVKAQGQMDFIRLHSKITQGQAIASLSNPSQKILANLIDARWKEALDIFEAATDKSYELSKLLKQERNPLQKRLDTVEQITPDRPEVQIWNALIIAATDGRAAALNWLRDRDLEPSTRDRARTLINLMEKAP
jgi:hypothetical protein